MMKTPTESVPKEHGYEKVLRKAGIHITRPRKLILSILGKMEDHPDAFEIFRRAEQIDKSI